MGSFSKVTYVTPSKIFSNFGNKYCRLRNFSSVQFAIVTLFTLALALGVQSSVIPWGGVVTQIAGHPLAHTSVISPLGLPLGAIALGHGPAAVAVHPPAAVAVHPPAAVAVHAAPAAVHVPAAVPAAVHVPAVVAGPGSYVAKTRGAIHTAPLAGHLNSVANVNVAPAPGTI
ncbi:adult cuticle protein 1-like [Lucilia sericata]|uniref:adult cuticle protein 1-like n=1 Tax=Lucilia sericata TaxID=13632 RepID=UPI0018A83D1E|nr:adult cuticle protein 1-like [Lucilia sericata]